MKKISFLIYFSFFRFVSSFTQILCELAKSVQSTVMNPSCCAILAHVGVIEGDRLIPWLRIYTNSEPLIICLSLTQLSSTGIELFFTHMLRRLRT